jgi:hypothetical protein
MTRHLISFDDGEDLPEEEMSDVAQAGHEVVHEAKDAGVWVFGGGLESQMSERRGHHRDGHRRPVPEDQGGPRRSRSSTCPHARRRTSGRLIEAGPATARTKTVLGAVCASTCNGCGAPVASIADDMTIIAPHTLIGSPFDSREPLHDLP